MIEWHELTEHRLPPMWAQVLLRRRASNHSGQVKYIVAARHERRARDMRPLGWQWSPKVTVKHITHFAYINEPLPSLESDHL